MLFFNLFFAITLSVCECMEQRGISRADAHIVSSGELCNIFPRKPIMIEDRVSFIAGTSHLRTLKTSARISGTVIYFTSSTLILQ